MTVCEVCNLRIERASVLFYVYIFCLVYFSVGHILEYLKLEYNFHGRNEYLTCYKTGYQISIRYSGNRSIDKYTGTVWNDHI